jgi:hypothetical protein
LNCELSKDGMKITEEIGKSGLIVRSREYIATLPYQLELKGD